MKKEVMLMTLARATSSDANIDSCEVSTVQKIMQPIPAMPSARPTSGWRRDRRFTKRRLSATTCAVCAKN